MKKYPLSWNVIEEKLKSFLSPKARKGVSDEGGDEVG